MIGRNDSVMSAYLPVIGRADVDLRSANHFFLNDYGRRLDVSAVHRNVLRSVTADDLHRPEDHKGPRLHDFRHQFAVRTLVEWYRPMWTSSADCRFCPHSWDTATSQTPTAHDDPSTNRPVPSCLSGAVVHYLVQVTIHSCSARPSPPPGALLTRLSYWFPTLPGFPQPRPQIQPHPHFAPPHHLHT